MNKTKIGFLPAISIVVANMVGVGVFTSLGFQLKDIQDYRVLLALWIVGGILALFGSFSYSELSATFPRSGGEYHFLKLSFGPQMGFLSGWTSAIIGFAAPIAAAAHAFSIYFSSVLNTGWHPLVTASALIAFLTLIHCLKIEIGTRFQVFTTAAKVLTMALFIAAGLFVSFQSGGQGFIHLQKGIPLSELASSGFWVGLIYVSYAYSGWNATSYIIEDIHEPERNVPKSIVSGTLIVMSLYTLINLTFLVSAPAKVLAGQPDVAEKSASYLFGSVGSLIVSSLVSFFLVSTVSSMTFVGPRVIKRIAEDYPTLTVFGQKSPQNIPVRAILLQSTIAWLILMTSTFEDIIKSAGFILCFFTTMTVIGLMILRRKMPHADWKVKTPLYPIPPLVYAGFNLWIMGYVLLDSPKNALYGIGFLCIGSVIYLMNKDKINK